MLDTLQLHNVGKSPTWYKCTVTTLKVKNSGWIFTPDKTSASDRVTLILFFNNQNTSTVRKTLKI